MSIPGLECPENMDRFLQFVLDGEYRVAANVHKAPTVLDIGANCGAFAVWALKEWPGAKIHCYEPAKDAFEYLKRNLGDRAELHNCAVGDTGANRLYHGKNNNGEASVYGNPCTSDDDFEDIEVLAPSLLPPADILKMDCEGSEAIVLAGMRYKPQLVMLEYHNDQLRRIVDAQLAAYTLIGAAVYGPGIGVAKYLHSENVRGLTPT